MSNHSPPHMGIPEDLFSDDWNSAPDSTDCHQKELLENENDIHNENNNSTILIKEDENNDSTPPTNGNEKNYSTSVTKENDLLPPVHPSSSGEGFPYAPMNWPNPGDNWGWRVGKRFNGSGYFQDRFLYLPTSLRQRNSQKMFASKPALEKYIQSQFPDTDIEAFFASFSWKIPAIMETPAKVDVPSAPQEPPPEVGTEETKTGPRASLRKRKEIKQEITTPVSEPKRKQSKKGTPHSSQGKGKLKASVAPTTSKRQTRQTLKHSVELAPKDTDDMVDLSVWAEVPTEEFDNYLNSLDEILAQPQPEGPIPHSVSINSSVQEDEMAEARIRLSLLLDMDFSSLIRSQDLTELTSLASKLQKDPSLSAEQLVKLKLIEEIPSFSEVFLENKEVMEQADKFFEALEVNKAKVTSLRKEYSELKEQATALQSEVDSNSLNIQEIDAQIAQLKSHRNELMKIIENKKKDKLELSYNQRLVANSIPKVVNAVQDANSKRPEWERKKENAIKREAEILSKFAALRGFSFRIGNFLDFSHSSQESAPHGARMESFSSHGNGDREKSISLTRGNFSSHGHGDGGTFMPMNSSISMPMKREGTAMEGYPTVPHSRGPLSWL
ncbi:hypothetical protein SLE2022_170570 [Rubroshorea leprosula]